MYKIIAQSPGLMLPENTHNCPDASIMGTIIIVATINKVNALSYEPEDEGLIRAAKIAIIAKLSGTEREIIIHIQLDSSGRMASGRRMHKTPPIPAAIPRTRI